MLTYCPEATPIEPWVTRANVPSSRFRNRRPSTQYSRAGLRPHFVFIPHSRSGRSGVLLSEGSHFTTYKWSVPAGGGGVGVSQSYCYIERSLTHARAPAYVMYDVARAGSPGPAPGWRTLPPARPRLIYDPRVCFQGSANKDDLHQRNSRPAGWLAGRRRPDYWECARPPTEGHFENLEMTTDRETGSRYYFVNRIYLDCISILVSRSADEFWQMFLQHSFLEILNKIVIYFIFPWSSIGKALGSCKLPISFLRLFRGEKKGSIEIKTHVSFKSDQIHIRLL